MSLTRREFLSAGAGTVAALALNPFDNNLTWPNTAAATAENPPLAIGFALGDSLFGITAEEIDKRLGLVKGLGANAFRVDFDGAVIQPKQVGEYDWQTHDRIMAAAEKAGLAVLATVTFTPPSNRVSGESNDYPARPRNVTAFAELGGGVAARYGKWVKKYDIWNAPNSSPNPPGADPAEYAQLFNAIRSKIKRAQSDAIVSIGSLGDVQTVKSAGTMLPADFLDACYAARIAGFDAVSFQAYSMPRVPDPNYNDAQASNYFLEIEGGSGIYIHNNLLAVMAKHGDAHLPIWITEIGATTDGTGQESTWTDVPNNWGSTPDSYVSDQIQADTISEGLTMKFPEANVTDRYVYTLMDRVDPTKKPVPLDHFGVLSADYKPKPAAAVFEATAKQLLGASH